MATPTVRPLVCLLVVLLAACSQSSDPLDTTLPGTAVEIGPIGGSAGLAEGLVVEAVAGTFGSPASFAVTPGGTAPLPAGATAVGAAVTLSASVDLAAPLIVGLPIPAGTATDDLMMLHTDDAGEQQLLGGWVEDGTYFAATPGLSQFQLVRHLLSGELASLAAQHPTTGGLLLPPSISPGISSTEPGFDTEWTLLSRGLIDSPAHRSVRVIGPGEVAVGQTTSFTAVDFDSIAGQLVDYSWQVHGEGLAIVDTVPGGGVLAEATGVGRALLTVEATDPVTGATAFGSRRVFAVEETTFTIVALPSRSLCFYLSHEPSVTATAVGGTPPYRWTWTWSDGVSGTQEGESLSIGHDRIKSDIVLEMKVTDATGLEAQASVAVRGLPGESITGAALLSGPFTGTVGEGLAYRILTWEAEAFRLPLEVTIAGAAGTLAVEGETARVTFLEPGWGLIHLWSNRDGVAPAQHKLIWTALVRITGDPPPAEARFAIAPAEAGVGSPVSFRIETRGGVIAGLQESDRFYAAEIDFGDGTVQPVPIPATTALEWSGADAEHAWAQAGTYTVTLTVITPDGQTAEATAEVEVTGEQRAVGEFQLAAIDGLEIIENRVVLIISGDQVAIQRFQFHTVYQVMRFEIGAGGETVSVPTDCTQESEMLLQSAELTLDPADGRIGGTVTVRDLMEMAGPDCPFGGGSRDVIREGAVEGTLVGGVITLTLRFPTIPEAAEAAYQIVANVR
ncbi:MAG: PKD domain-containing protein [Acidimicrobiia bacterium]|nr:PKD domain-containing protein [Acidimicrobiia bacterium]